jgi:hypothetical protein
MPLADPDVELVLAEVGDVGEEFGGVVVHGFAGDEPADVGPESSFAGRVRVAFFVGVLVMLAVGGDPEDGAAFESEGGADGEEVLHPFGSFVTAMGEEAMVAHADAEASCYPPEEHGYKEGLPVEHEESSDGSDVERNHDEERQPDDGLREGAIGPEEVWLLHRLIGLPSAVKLEAGG